MANEIEPTPLPCRCENGHAFDRDEAKAVNYLCPICGAKITCDPLPGLDIPEPAKTEKG